jgi:hypothetical protein
VTLLRLVGRYRRFGETYCLQDGEKKVYETMVSTYKFTRRHNPDEEHRTASHLPLPLALFLCRHGKTELRKTSALSLSCLQDSYEASRRTGKQTSSRCSNHRERDRRQRQKRMKQLAGKEKNRSHCFPIRHRKWKGAEGQTRILNISAF